MHATPAPSGYYKVYSRRDYIRSIHRLSRGTMNTIRTIVAGLAYIAMVIVNVLANSLPINDRTTGEISNSYANLFAPAGITFAIWGLIYLLLAGYLIYQFSSRGRRREALYAKVNLLFIGTSIANIAWIFSWHYDLIGLSVLIMAILLVLLIRIADIMRVQRFGPAERLFIAVPFAVYFGWITVATIANITVFLVSINWDGFGIAEAVWTSIILLIGATIGIVRMRMDRSIAYGSVLVWAYGGILLKHLSPGGFDGQYPSIIATVLVCLVLFGAFIGMLIMDASARRKADAQS